MYFSNIINDSSVVEFDQSNQNFMSLSATSGCDCCNCCPEPAPFMIENRKILINPNYIERIVRNVNEKRKLR